MGLSVARAMHRVVARFERVHIRMTPVLKQASLLAPHAYGEPGSSLFAISFLSAPGSDFSPR